MDYFTSLSNHLSSLDKNVYIVVLKVMFFSPSDVSGHQSLDLRSPCVLCHLFLVVIDPVLSP